jgi:hypothetical protein
MENDDTFDLKAEMETGIVIRESVRSGGYTASCEGKVFAVCGADGFDDLLVAIEAWQTKAGYFPNIFQINDHGNVSQVVIIRDSYGAIGYDQVDCWI